MHEIDLHGGRLDGTIYTLPDDSDGLPMMFLRTPRLPPISMTLTNSVSPEPVTLEIDVYVRDSISENTHRWKYYLVGTGPNA